MCHSIIVEDGTGRETEQTETDQGDIDSFKLREFRSNHPGKFAELNRKMLIEGDLQ